MLLSAVVRFAVARTFDVPWIAPDEMIYGLVGQSLWESGTLTIRDAAVPYYSLLTPALVGLPLAVGELARGVAIAQALQALAMSLVAVPVYLWGKPIVGTRWALAAAALAVLPPALWYGGLLMTEALFYPLVVAALLGLARMLEEPTLVRQGTFLLILSFAAAVRLQALVLLPVLLVATGLVRLVRALARDPPPARSAARSRRPLGDRLGAALRDRRERSLRRVRSGCGRGSVLDRHVRSDPWHIGCALPDGARAPAARDRDAGSARRRGRERPNLPCARSSRSPPRTSFFSSSRSPRSPRVTSIT